MAEWLGGLDRPAMATLLGNRPDALIAPEPRSRTELAERLGSPESLVAVLRSLPQPCLQLTEAALALGAPTVAELAGFLEQLSLEHDDAVAAWLRVLSERGLVWMSGAGAIGTAPGLDVVFPSPLGLGAPVRIVLESVPVDRMRRILRELGVPGTPARRGDVLAELLRLLTDPDIVRNIAATAPRAVATELEAWAGAGGLSEDEWYVSSYDFSGHERRSAAAEWAIERGLVFRSGYSYGWVMPGDISRALRGADYRAPFVAAAPPVPTEVVGGAELASHSAAAVSHFAELLLTVVDRLARVSLPALRSGGVGAREIAKLAKAVGCTLSEARLVLELCGEVGVLEDTGAVWRLSAAAAPWRALQPTDRIAALLIAWSNLSRVPSEARDEDGKAVPVLKARACAGCRRARQNLLQTMAELPTGAAAEPLALADRALWRRPFVHVLAQDEGQPFASILDEATTLGVVAAGALTPLGRALIAGDEPALRDLLAAALPEPNDRALFGADLTAVVTGAPTAELSRLLDAAADRESRGAATVWRFTPGSVRRALDEGHHAAELEQALTGIATAGLPQPLRYLIADIGRRHGNLRVSAAASVVRSEDEALLRQAVGDRALRKLGVRLLAPSVLGADADAETVLGALRAAGYLPMPDGDTPPAPALPVPARAGVRRVHRPAPRVVEASELAARLLASPVGAAATTSPTEQQLAKAGASVSDAEIRMLAHAVESGGSVAIGYQGSSGRLTQRVITAPDLSGDVLVAWCELRSDERWFRVDRIVSVSPAG